MKVRKQIAIVHNLTGGGAVRVLKETTRILSKYYTVKTFTPEKYNNKGEKGIQKIFSYLKYIYFILPMSYKRISTTINNESFQTAILHHDAYIKAPPALSYLNKKSIYILHEPPREFYEPLKFHAPLIGDKVFTLLRSPIYILDKVLTKRATKVVTNSKFSKNTIDRIYGINSKLIYCGVSDIFREIRGVEQSTRCISVGSLLPYKGHDLTISAIGKLEIRPNLLIVGRGRKNEKEKLYALAKKNRIKLQIRDTITDRELNELYNKSKIFINSAYKEPFGLCALEALTAGSHVVTVSDCGTQELKKYYPNKVTVVSRNAKSISVGIQRALSNRINKRGTTPRLFKWENTVSELRKIIEAD